MARTFDWLLWHVLHLAIALLCAISAAYSWIVSFFSALNAESGQVKEILSKKPITVAVVFEAQEAADKDGKISRLLCLLSSANVSHVTLYDAQGKLKLLQQQIQNNLNLLETKDPRISCYSEVDMLLEPSESKYLNGVQSVSNRFISVEKYSTLLEHKSGSERRQNQPRTLTVARDHRPASDKTAISHMKVEFLSLQDGKESLVRAARHVCQNAYQLHYAEQSTKKPKLTEEDINKSLHETGGEGRDPDLLLLFGKTRSLLGFPPWRLRLTEIVHMGALKDLTPHSFVSAFNEFANKSHRYGK